MAWQIAYEVTDTGEWTNTNTRNYRDWLAANVSDYDGTKVRITIKAGDGEASIQGSSIGTCTGYVTDFNSPPTRITWVDAGGGDGITVSSGQTAVSDEITFNFDKTSAHLIHFYMLSRDNWRYKANDVIDGMFWNDATAQGDETLIEDITTSGANYFTHIVKIEVYEGEAPTYIPKIIMIT